MWHEARRQERKIRGMLVDYRRRAERRRDFYEKIKADPTQFLQIHGRQCKIHLDPAVAAAADSAVMMPWQGQIDNLIDRFDVRAHLDYIPPIKKEDDSELTQEERHYNYERYRIVAQNAFLGISEEKFLKQLHLEEQFGYTETKGKKEQKSGGAAIGFNYDDGTGISQPPALDTIEENSDEDSDSDLDVDLAINVSKMDSTQAHEMNKHGRSFGMVANDFYSFLTNDLEEAETYRLAKEEEHEKALFSGRKSRRERRAHREKRLANRVISPPSYAARELPTYPVIRDESKSPSRSPSPENAGKITYITSFGDDEETPSGSKTTYADKVKYGKSKNDKSSEKLDCSEKKKSRSSSREVFYYGRKRRRSRSRSRSRSRRKSRSLSENSKSRSRRSRSRSKRSRSRSRKSRSVSKGSRSRSRRSRTRSRERYGSHSKSVRTYRRRSSRSSSLTSSGSSKSSSCRSVSPKRVSKSKSRSPSVRKESPPKVVTRYYGRKKSDRSSSDSSDSESQENRDVDMKPAYNPVSSDSKSRDGNNSGTAIKKTTANLTVIERLKRKRQALLNRQFKKDKIAEELKAEREKQEQQTREDELREMAIKLRRRQREKRHAYDSNQSSSSSDSDSSKSAAAENKEKSLSPSPRHKSRERESSRSDKHERRDRRDSKDGERARDTRSNSRERDRDSRRDRDRKDPERDRSSRRYKDRESARDRDRRRDDRDKKEERRLVDY